MKATEKQIRYAKMLLQKSGYNADGYFCSQHKELGLNQRERAGKIEDMSYEVASKIITALK